MPVRTIRNETDGTFSVVSGSWSNSSPWGSLPNGAGVLKSATSGVYRCTLPANHTFTGGVLIGYGTSAGTANATVTVDGTVIQPAWNQKFGTSANANYNLPRILSFPFVLNPAKGTTQIIDLTAGADGGLTYIDGIELYQAATPVAGRLTSTGHSMLYGVIDGSTKGPRSTTRFSKLMANYLAATQWLGVSSWTDDNQGVPSEDLTNGGNNSGLAGGANTSVLYTQFANQQMWSNGVVPTPGWMRLEAGDLWPATHAPRLDAGGLFSTDADYMVGVPQWWARAFQYGLFMQNVNDLGMSTLYDAPSPNNVNNAASALSQIQTATPTGTVSGGSVTFTQGANSSVACSVLNNVTGIQSCLDAATPAKIDWAVTGAAGSPLSTGGAGVTMTARTPGVPAASIAANNAGVTGGGSIAMATTTAGRNSTPAGAGVGLNVVMGGYGAARFVQRFREALIRVALAISPTPRVGIVGYPNVINGAAMGAAQLPIYYQGYDTLTRAVLDESWIKALSGGSPFYFISPLVAMTGHACSASTSDSHPGDVGHADIFNEIRRVHDALNTVLPTLAVR